MPTKPIRILVADDQSLFREGICLLIATNPHFLVVGEAASGEMAVSCARRLQPDVVLLDLSMPGMSGIACIPQILHAAPSARIVVLTSFDDDCHVFGALTAGAHGYVLKQTASVRLLQAIEDVVSGKTPVDGGVTHTLIRHLSRAVEPAMHLPASLSNREQDVLKLLAKGLSNIEIAVQLGIGQRTVETHVQNILAKLEVSSRTQAVIYALRGGVPQAAPVHS